MGTRGQVLIKDTGVYLYQHFDSYNLPDLVKSVIKRNDRWNDPEYLTRMIFSDMIETDITGSTSYGIGTVEHGDIEFLIVVDCEKQTIQVNNDNIETFKDLNENQLIVRKTETINFKRKGEE